MKKLLSFVLILCTSALFYNNVSNWHFHLLPNGMIVEHAHPYRPASSPEYPFEKHKHSDFEYLILEIIYYSGLIILLALAGLILYTRPGKINRLFEPVRIIPSLYRILPFLRGPPIPDPA